MKKDFVIEFKDVEITAVNAGVVTGKLQQMAGGWVYETVTTASNTPGRMNVSKTPIWFSTHKFDMLDELIEENQHDNTIIVYNYVEELAELKRRYPHAQTINDLKAIERWNEGKIELLLIHPKSAGHGLNLQHGGNKMVFVSLPWSLELYEQTVGRLHRSGQKHDVWVYLLLTNKTIDLRIWDALKDKRAISDIALEELK
jgi:SNF2 family DNA or RNA helicase